MTERGDKLTLDDVLLWLNDRLGKSVAVSVEFERGDFQFDVLGADGELHHWSEAAETARPWDAVRADNLGRYWVGEAVLDLTHVRPLEVFTLPSDPNHLTVRLDENTTLVLVEQQELPDE